MEAHGGGLVDPGEMPIAEELAEVRQLVAETRHVDAQFAELAEDIGAAAQRAVAEVAVAALERGVEVPVVGLELGELEIGELQDVDGFGGVGRLVDEQRGVPIDHDEVVLVVAQAAAGRFEHLLSGEVRRTVLGEQRGDLAAVHVQPGLGPERRSRRCAQRGMDAEDGVGLLFQQLSVGPQDVRRQLAADLFGQPPDVVIERAVGELEVVEDDEVLELLDVERDAHGDADGADRQQLDRHPDPRRSERSGAVARWQADGLRLVEEQMPRPAPAGVDLERRHRMPEQLGDRRPGHLVGDVVGVEIDDLAGEPGPGFRRAVHAATVSWSRTIDQPSPGSGCGLEVEGTSAEVAQTGSLRHIGPPLLIAPAAKTGDRPSRHRAECNSAIQQVTNLRYECPPPPPARINAGRDRTGG